jgi:hypothetical protein
MIHDPLDDLLDRSAPTTRAAAQVELDAMITDAGRTRRRAIRPRILMAAALATVLACSGVGLAAATDGFDWAPWAQKPIGAVQFTMGNGFQCELRFSEFTAGDDPALVAEVNDVLEKWYRSADVLGAVQPLVPTKLDDLGPIELQPGETLETLPPGEDKHREWVRQWTAWDLAVGDAESQELTRHGIDPGDPGLAGSERSGQIKCLDENHEPYIPGAGS